jgi:hypothetical protein
MSKGPRNRLSRQDKSNLEWDYSITEDRHVLADAYEVSLSTVDRITRFYRETGKFYWSQENDD